MTQNLCQLTTPKKKTRKDLRSSLFNKQMTKCEPATGKEMINHSKNVANGLAGLNIGIYHNWLSPQNFSSSCSSLPHPVTVVCCLCLLICRGVGNIKNAKAGIHDSQHFLYRVRSPQNWKNMTFAIGMGMVSRVSLGLFSIFFVQRPLRFIPWLP